MPLTIDEFENTLRKLTSRITLKLPSLVSKYDGLSASDRQIYDERLRNEILDKILICYKNLHKFNLKSIAPKE